MTEYDRQFFRALVYEKDGDLNLSQLLTAIMAIIGMVGFIWVMIINPSSSIVVQIAAWSFLGGAFASVLIASLPVAKAKILANAKLPAEFANAIAEAGKTVTESTDIKELSQKEQDTQSNTDVG